MGPDALVLEALGDDGQSVARSVHIGVVDLVRIAGEDDLGVGTAPGDDSLDLMRREILRFVDDQELIRKRATTDVRERFHLDDTR